MKTFLRLLFVFLAIPFLFFAVIGKFLVFLGDTIENITDWLYEKTGLKWFSDQLDLD